MAVARVSMRGAARWRGGHPWVYRSDVIERPDAPAGVVNVVDARGAPLGQALWSPASVISLRFLTRSTDPLGARFWAERIEAAVARRADVDAESTAYRVVHGEGDGLPSLVVDRYDRYLVVQILSAGLEAERASVLTALTEVLSPDGILLRNDVAVRRREGLSQAVELAMGEVPLEVEVQEGEIRYLAAPWTGQKTGAFLDQRENRIRAGQLSRGRVLDCFAYHGSFALHLARGADRVMAVDSSHEALQRAAANARLNGLDNLAFSGASVFEFLRAEEEAGARYDVIVLDPPAFAKRKDAVPRALRGYKELNLRAMRLLAPGGTLLTFSCSFHVGPPLFRQMLAEAAADAGRPVQWIETLGQALDHPEILQIPETGYLKGAILKAV